ncbi:MFS toxin efflux pump [Xylaria bambusicola]|uniref:MFS toxin efflux pump n=1 Tax=Xylaria bambusicola TaxID=326684 RepID=UPI00200796D0|nr:MFS toxin efflux pump [Xylaria bambusicola]KAI0520991.1 MFS toxin efflux pump [Xylaria bambusicola]
MDASARIDKNEENSSSVPEHPEKPPGLKVVARTATDGPTTPRHDDDDSPDYLRPWELIPVFTAMALAIFILGLDNTIVGTATPTITNEFHSLTDFGWYGSAYRLSTCSSQFLFSKIYEQWRVKWVLIIAVVILEIGSVVSASASSSPAFIVGRAIAGSGSAGILIGVFIAITHSVPPRWRPICNSTIGGLECIAMIVAPIIGGALTTYVTWRWNFWLNLPVGGVTIAILAVLFKDSKNQKVSNDSFVSKLKQLNILALFIFTGSIVSLLLALEWGGTTYDWDSARIIVLLVVAVVSFGVFMTWEVLRNDRATIPSSVLLNRTAGLCVLYAFCTSAAFNVVDYFLPIWFQAIKGASAASSGAMLLPSIIGLAVAAITSGFIVSFFGYYTPLMVLGSIMMTIGFGFLTAFTPSTGSSAWIGWQVLFGVGIGFAISQPWTAIQVALPPEDIPAGLSAISFAISIGAALIISISQNIFSNLLRDGLARIPGVDVEGIISHGATDLLKLVPPSQKERVLGAYNWAVTRTFWACVAVALLGFLAALGMEWKSVKKSDKVGDVQDTSVGGKEDSAV